MPRPHFFQFSVEEHTVIKYTVRDELPMHFNFHPNECMLCKFAYFKLFGLSILDAGGAVLPGQSTAHA